jgi:hypothetical protein
VRDFQSERHPSRASASRALGLEVPPTLLAIADELIDAASSSRCSAARQPPGHAALVPSESAAQDQRRSFYDRNGSFAGSSTTYNAGRNTSFYDKSGSFAGSAIRNSDGTTSFYDARGRFTGSVINTSPRR